MDSFNLNGKTALVLGIANRWSIAYAIAQALQEHGVRLARRRFESAGLEGRFERANAETLPFPDGQFDLGTVRPAVVEGDVQ